MVTLTDVLIFGFGAYLFEYHFVKAEKAREARQAADSRGKPLLNIGCRWTCPDSCIGDVNVDIMDCPHNHPSFVKADATDLSMFKDKQFGCVFASHIIEHLDDPEAAYAEWCRVGDMVIVLTPSPFMVGGFFHPDHKWLFLEAPPGGVAPSDFDPRNRVPTFFNDQPEPPRRRRRYYR